ncbi:MAG: hypothetical protein QOJ00_2006 [Actinomycetota bacterium]|jgi:hypothetical protein
MAAFVAEAVLSGDTPKADAPAGEVVAFWRANTTKQEVAAALFSVAAVAIVLFGSRLRRQLRSDGATVAFGGTILIAIGLSLYASFGLAAAHVARSAPATTLQTMNVLTRDDMYIPLAVGAALLLLGTASSVRASDLPRWFGGISVVLAGVACAAVVLGPIADGFGFLGFLTLVPWIPMLSVVVYRRSEAAPS